MIKKIMALGLAFTIFAGGASAAPKVTTATGVLPGTTVEAELYQAQYKKRHYTKRHHYNRHRHHRHYNHRHHAPRVHHGYSNAHYNWCAAKYKSYNRHTNTWRAYSGKTYHCRSPY